MARVLVAVLGSGIIAMLISRRYNISYVPLFIIAGMILGPIATLMPRNIAHDLFDYVRVFGLVMILFTEGHNLSWKLLKRNSNPRYGWTSHHGSSVGLVLLVRLPCAVSHRLPLRGHHKRNRPGNAHPTLQAVQGQAGHRDDDSYGVHLQRPARHSSHRRCRGDARPTGQWWTLRKL